MRLVPAACAAGAWFTTLAFGAAATLAAQGIATGGPAAEHGPTARALLTVPWTYVRVEATSASAPLAAGRGSLPAAVALARLAGDDPRPLLVVRDCSCEDGHAGLERLLREDRTVLLARWFRCVRLPRGVPAAEKHPLGALFAAEPQAHVLVATADGQSRWLLDADVGQSELWRRMSQVLKLAHVGDPEAAVKELLALLPQFDRVDRLLGEAAHRMQVEIEKQGATAEARAA